MSINFDFDVIVVGGGPAGAAAAIHCSRGGLKTLLLEARSEPREQPGESLQPGIGPLFGSLGIAEQIDAAGFLRYPGHAVRSQSGDRWQAYEGDRHNPWLGYEADRGTLREIMLQGAISSGTIVANGERAVRPLISGGAVTGVVGASAVYSAAFVIDAAGSSRWLKQHLGGLSLRVSALLVAGFGWVERSSVAGGTPTFQMEDGGWSWVAPVSDARVAWVTLDLNGRWRGGPCLPAAVAGCVPIGRPGARDVTWRIARPCAGAGYFMAGDSAWRLDPASSHGVQHAVMSGMVAAQAILDVLRGQRRSEAVRKGYCAWAEDMFCADAAALISLYSEIEHAPSWLAAASNAVRYIATRPVAEDF